MEARSPVTHTPRQSISSNGTDPSKAAIDKEYLRNVLIQFFEHKDKRVSDLIPLYLTFAGTVTSRIVDVIEFLQGGRDEVVALKKGIV
jgi:hypothetical protein